MRNKLSEMCDPLNVKGIFLVIFNLMFMHHIYGILAITTIILKTGD